jgi:beta-glucosidase
MKLKSILFGLLAATLSITAQQKPIYLDINQPIEARVEDALKRMTLEEKVAMTHAQSKFSSAGVPRLGIPENWMTDGPHGIREELLWDNWGGAGWTNDSCIAFPALTCLAATWNPEMSALFGKSIGEEARYRNKNVLLGPGVNIYRTPLNGRNFEYMGEDPYLASRMVVPYIQGVQKNGVAACVKHYALNNQEVNRLWVNVVIDDRALHEIYLPAFKASVQEGGAWAIMSAYNKYKDQHCSHNQYLLNDILKRDWGFDGVVISDWGAVHNTKEAITNGLDMEFGTFWADEANNHTTAPYNLYYLADPYLELLRKGEVGTKELDDKVRRILRLAFRTTMSKECSFGSFGTEEHALAGRKIAEEGIVLLQNNKNVLPVDLSKTKKIVVVGENATKRMTIGGGSSGLKAKYEVSPLEGIKKRVGNSAEVVYVKGYESWEEKNLPKGYETWEGKNSESKNIDPAALRTEAVNAVKGADIVFFIGGLNKNEHQDSEGDDRRGLELPYEQDKLIAELVKANPKTAVILLSGNAVAMPWVKNVPSIVQAWYNGSEAGNALASVLFGDVNPSGKLPITFPVQLKDNGAHAAGEYPGDKTNMKYTGSGFDGANVKYNESIFVGYRWADKQKIKPLFAFGHGLSYTTFEYGKPVADKKSLLAGDAITFTVKVKNTGTRKGKEVVQLYISDKKSSLPRPEKELKGFSKVELAPGEEKTVTFTVNKDALSFYDDKKGEWIAEPGQFEAIIAASAADIKGKVAFELK